MKIRVLSPEKRCWGGKKTITTRRRDLFEVTQLVRIKAVHCVRCSPYLTFFQTLLSPESFVSINDPRDLRRSEARNGLIRKIVGIKT